MYKRSKTLAYEEKYNILATITGFTLGAIKSWCAAAVECVHSVCAGPVVLTGMTCTVIDICFKECGRTIKTVIFDKICNNNNNTTNHGYTKNIFELAKQHSKQLRRIVKPQRI